MNLKLELHFMSILGNALSLKLDPATACPRYENDEHGQIHSNHWTFYTLYISHLQTCISSAESKKSIADQRCSIENQKGACYCHRLCTAIAPFWFSTEHLWTVITPFWLLTDDIMRGHKSQTLTLFMSTLGNALGLKVKVNPATACPRYGNDEGQHVGLCTKLSHSGLGYLPVPTPWPHLGWIMDPISRNASSPSQVSHLHSPDTPGHGQSLTSTPPH